MKCSCRHWVGVETNKNKNEIADGRFIDHSRYWPFVAWNIIAPCGLINWLHFPSNRFHIAHTEWNWCVFAGTDHRSKCLATELKVEMKIGWRWFTIPTKMAIKTTYTHQQPPSADRFILICIWIRNLNRNYKLSIVCKRAKWWKFQLENRSFVRWFRDCFMQIRVNEHNNTNKPNEKFKITANHTLKQNVNFEICIFLLLNRQMGSISQSSRHSSTHSFSIQFSHLFYSSGTGDVAKCKKRIYLANLQTEASRKITGPFKILWRKKWEIRNGFNNWMLIVVESCCYSM